MTKAEILDIVYIISANRADPATCDRYFDELMDQVGRVCSEMTKIETAAVTKGTSDYVLPDECIIESAILFDGRQLSKTTIQQLEAFDINWKQKTGKSFCYTKDELTARTIRLYPTPDVSTGPYDYSHGEPIGLDFPPYSLTYIFASRNNSNIPYHIALALVFQILAWEFIRPSKQQSISFAQLCQQLSTMLFKMTGINWIPPQQPKRKEG